MHQFTNTKVIDFMAAIQSSAAEQYDIALQIRALYFACDPSLLEDIKYGGITFFRDSELLGGIFFYKQHISIEFSHGAKLADPLGVLEGKGKLRRHIKIRQMADLKSKDVATYILAALT